MSKKDYTDDLFSNATNPATGDSMEGTKTGKVTGDFAVNMRVSPDKTAEVVETVRKGETVTVIGEKDGYVQVKVGHKTGYIPKQYVEE